MYRAVVKSHHCATAMKLNIFVNVKASALPNKEGREMSGNFIQRGDGRRLRAQGTFRRQALTPEYCPNEGHKIGEVREAASNGVMDEGSGKVQEASTYLKLHKRDTILERSGKGHPTG